MKKAIESFLSGVDIVLNSNTYLLELERHSEVVSDEEAIHLALFSKKFDQALYKQDLEREWEIFHDSDVTDDKLVYTPIPFNKQKGFAPERLDKAMVSQFLESMLFAGNPGGFHSPYGTEKSQEEARKIVNDLKKELNWGPEWHFFKLDTSSLFLPFNKNTGLVYWDNTPSDTFSAWLTHDRIYFLISNGAG